MLGRFTSRLYICVFLLLMLLLFGCDYQGNLNINQPPEVYISSFTGRDTPEEADVLGSVPYQQKIYWYGRDADGVVVGYAFRILNEHGDPISTAGNEVISPYTPPELSEADPLNKGGWVLHYQKGTSEDYPLYHDLSRTTVWTEKIFTDVNFPAADEAGSLVDRASAFEIYAIDNKGAISKKAIKYFYTMSKKPSILVSTSKGTLDTLKVTPSVRNTLGQGVRMIFSMPDDRIGIITNKPWYFRYKVYQADKDDQADTPLPGEDTSWHSTQYLPDTGEVLFRAVEYPDSKQNMVPALRSNFASDHSTLLSVTIFDVQVVDLAGVMSDPIRKYFYVNDKFSPSALIYVDRTYALGNDHYTYEADPLITGKPMIMEPPKTYTSTGTRVSQLFYPTPVFDAQKQVTDFEWQLFGDPFTKFWFRWGYFGEYRNNDPHANRENVGASEVFEAVLDPNNGNANYGSEISNYYISLDGMQYPYPPLQVAGLQDHQYPDFLRVPTGHEISQMITRSGFSPGRHTLSIMVEDLQDKVSDVSSLDFNIKRKKTPSERNGVLYIDFGVDENTDNNGIRAFYEGVFADLNMPFTYVKREVVNKKRSEDRFKSYNYFRNGTRLFPITLLNDYEYVIVATDLRGGTLTTFIRGDGEIEGIMDYLNAGGKVILVGNWNLRSAFTIVPSAPMISFFRDYFGFPLVSRPDEDINTLHNNSTANPNYIFLDPTPVAPGAPNLNIITARPPDEDANIYQNGAINTATSIASETVLAPGTTILYRFNCSSNATTATYAKFHNKPVGFKFTPTNPSQGTTYTFTFPIYNLQSDSVKQLMSYIMDR